MEYPFKDLMPLDEATARDGYYKDWTHIDADTFHQISELVKFIREKGYGSDTREAIAQALERVYYDAMKSGNADMELSMARKHFRDLAARLDAGDTDMRNISVDWINKDLGKLDQTFMTEEFLQQMAGNAPINAVPADNSITPAKTTFFDDEVNLFNMETAKTGFFSAGGIENANPDYYVSDYIPVSVGRTYIVPANFNALGDYFNSSKVYMSRINRVDMAQPFADKSIFVVPSGVSMVRVNGYKGAGANVSTPLDQFMLVPSNVYPSQYIPFGSLPKIQAQYIPKSEDVLTNALYGKKVLWNGDSLMMATPDPEGGWAGRIAKKNSMNSTNYGIGGGTIATGTYSGATPRHWISVDVDNMSASADYVILEGGRNDWALEVPLGEITSGYTDTFDDTTFCGGFEKMLYKVRKKYLGKKVGFIIPYKMELQHYPYGSSSPKADAYYDKAREMLEKWSVPYIDLYKTSNLTIEIPEVKSEYFADQTHINAKGYEVTTPQIEAWMRTL